MSLYDELLEIHKMADIVKLRCFSGLTGVRSAPYFSFYFRLTTGRTSFSALVASRRSRSSATRATTHRWQAPSSHTCRCTRKKRFVEAIGLIFNAPMKKATVRFRFRPSSSIEWLNNREPDGPSLVDGF